MRRTVALCLALLLGACGGGAAAPGAPDPEPVPPGPNPDGRDRPNILFIVTEDQGVQMGAYGTPGLPTPNLDALAASGTRFARAYVTLGTCTGSKSSAFTGLYNHTTGATGNVNEYVGSYAQLRAENPPWFRDPASPYNLHRIDARYPTLVEILRSNGYFTGLHNKFHLSPHWKFPYDVWSPDGTPSYDQVRDFIASARPTGRTWFLMHVLTNSHRPYPDGDTRVLSIDRDAIVPPAHLPDTPAVRQDWAEYFQGIVDADARDGEALRALDDSGERARTLVVFWGDHGPSYHRGKLSAYDFGLHIPLVFSGPGIAAGQVRSELFSTVDFVPTLLDLIVLPAPAVQQGVSHAVALGGGTPASPPESLVGTAASDRSVTDGRWHLLSFADPADTVMPADNRDFDPWRNRVYRDVLAKADMPGFAPFYRWLDLADAALPRFTRPRFELYDLAQDPWEVDDRAADPAQAANLERMKALLRRWQDRVADPAPRP